MFATLIKLRLGLFGDILRKEWLEDRQKFASHITF